MRGLLCLVLLVAWPATLAARPRADVTFVWAPGAETAVVGDVVRRAGAAMLDRSPPHRADRETAALLARGIVEYQDTHYDQAAQLLERARAIADTTGASGLTQNELSDLFLYRGLVKVARQDTATSWDEFIVAVTVSPTRILDTAQFSPTVRDQIERARAAVLGRGTAELVIAAPLGCTAVIDGATIAARPSANALPGAGIPRPLGPHWVHVDCVDRAPWGARLELTSNATIAAANLPLVPPAIDELLIQARTMGAEAFLVAEVVGRVATVRLVGIDGRERDRRTITVIDDLRPLADVIRELLIPAPPPRWYRSRWAWAVGAGLLTAAIAIPITAAALSDDRPTSVTVRPQGLPW